MAIHFHVKNECKQVHINEETQNFEYELQETVIDTNCKKKLEHLNLNTIS